MDVSSQNVSMSALNTSRTPNLVKVSSTVLLPTTLPSRTPRPLAPTSMSRESISNHVKLTPSNSSEKSQKLLLQSHTNSLSKLGSNKMGLHKNLSCFTAGSSILLSRNLFFKCHYCAIYWCCYSDLKHPSGEFFRLIRIYWKDIIFMWHKLCLSCMNSHMQIRTRCWISLSFPGGSLGFQKFFHLRIPRHRDCLRCNICRLAPSWSLYRIWLIDKWFDTLLVSLPTEYVLIEFVQWRHTVWSSRFRSFDSKISTWQNFEVQIEATRTRLIFFIAIIFMVAVLSLHAVSASRDFIAGVFEGSCVVDQEAVATLLPCEVRARFSWSTNDLTCLGWCDWWNWCQSCSTNHVISSKVAVYIIFFLQIMINDCKSYATM